MFVDGLLWDFFCKVKHLLVAAFIICNILGLQYLRDNICQWPILGRYPLLEAFKKKRQYLAMFYFRRVFVGSNICCLQHLVRDNNCRWDRICWWKHLWVAAFKERHLLSMTYFRAIFVVSNISCNSQEDTIFVNSLTCWGKHLLVTIFKKRQ